MTIDRDSGELYVIGDIDRERFNWLNFTVGATDSGLPTRTSYASVFLKVFSKTIIIAKFSSK